ncbi:hypothetical protein SAMN04489740_3224 [Arthrobacter alpinus]|uniref:Uncharacterized protein n=1 Tax=Arthrobacter alpinus TaxID=656366 RepID=A0A1H5MXK7_9MICC|nr:hypothetical protein SAMN04489740_3224 [Arthrobacter alpinus]
MASPFTSAQRPTTWLLAKISKARSYREETRWKCRVA